MMKKLFLIAFITCVSFSVKAQKKSDIQLDTIPVVDGNYQFQEVVNVNGSLKDQLYRNAKVYFMDIFTGAKDAFQYDDKQEGKIIGKGVLTVDDYKSVFPGVAVLKWDVNYNTEITCKDGKYMLRLYDIVITKEYHVAEGHSRTVHLTMKDAYEAIAKQHGAYKTLYPKVLNKMAADFKSQIGTLKESMDKKQPQQYSAAF